MSITSGDRRPSTDRRPNRDCNAGSSRQRHAHDSGPGSSRNRRLVPDCQPDHRTPIVRQQGRSSRPFDIFLDFARARAAEAFISASAAALAASRTITLEYWSWTKSIILVFLVTGRTVPPCRYYNATSDETSSVYFDGSRISHAARRFVAMVSACRRASARLYFRRQPSGRLNPDRCIVSYDTSDVWLDRIRSA
jgi:hypothetical protein